MVEDLVLMRETEDDDCCLVSCCTVCEERLCVSLTDTAVTDVYGSLVSCACSRLFVTGGNESSGFGPFVVSFGEVGVLLV